MRRTRGFTLVEVLVAMGIFLLGITALMALFQYGGSLQVGARSHAALAPVLEPLVEDLVDEAWLPDPAGGLAGLRDYRGEPVPGAPEYRYDLEVSGTEGPSGVRRAVLILYRDRRDHPVARVPFLLPRRVPVARRLETAARP